MKNIIYSALMIIFVSSCQGKKDLVPTSEGYFSIRFIAKNGEVNQPYSHYTNVWMGLRIPEGGPSRNNPTVIGINGEQDINNAFTTRISFSSEDNFRTTLPKYKPQIDFSVGHIINEQPTLVSLLSNSPEQELIITKNDADSLGGRFRVRLEKLPQGSSTSYTEFEGHFCIAKKGRF